MLPSFKTGNANHAIEARQNVTMVNTATSTWNTYVIVSLTFMRSCVQASVSTAQGLVIGLVCGVGLLLGLHTYAPALLKGTSFPAVSSEPIT